MEKSSRRSGDRDRERDRDWDRDRDRRSYDRDDSRDSRRRHSSRDRDSYYEEEDDDIDEDYDRSHSRRSERSDSRGDRNDRDYDNRSDRSDYDREYQRIHRDNVSRRPPITSISPIAAASFSRPATYDPRLAQRARGQDGGDDRQRQLKDELGLSDEDMGVENRVVPSTATITSPEIHARCLKMEQELQIARENEQKAQESLGKLQLLSKSQTAILKTTMMKKLQERDDQLEEMNNVIKELENKLETAGISFEVFSRPIIKSEGQAETEVEMGAMKREVDRLIEENNSLKSQVKSANIAAIGKPSVDESVSTRVVELETEKDQLEKKLNSTQQQVVALKKQLASGTVATGQDTLPPAAPTSDAAEMRELQKKVTDAEEALKSAQNKVRKLETELSTLQSNKEASTTSSQVNSDKIRSLETQLAEQINNFQTKEAAWEEKHAKLKSTAETELGKIKEQAKKAILDLKKKLEVSTKGQDSKQKVLVAVQTQLGLQKKEITQLRTAIIAQQQQVPVLAKQVTDKILQRVQRQADAMAGVVENYKREVKERKRLFNLVQELKGNIRVLCRVRPISKNELAQGNKAVCKFTPEEITVAGEKGKVKSWEFDHVFDPQSTQEELFAEVKPLVTSVLDGYNVCIFAYGQTGSGKTHTMSGSTENPGINTRALQELFVRKVERQHEIQDEITVSIMEIYNEVIRDLLSPDAVNTNLSVRQGPTGNFVPGLTTIPVQTLEEVFDLIKKGNKSRSTHATDMNEHSSRSHSILSIQLKSANLVTNAVSNGRLFLVDLAGSERLSKTGAEGLRLKEAQNINKSLSALGDVIAARASKAKHVPYRNSSLTYLLQDALGGDSKTLMVACASPVDYNSEETFCTLNFAARARSVEMGKATKNVTKAE